MFASKSLEQNYRRFKTSPASCHIRAVPAGRSLVEQAGDPLVERGPVHRPGPLLGATRRGSYEDVTVDLDRLGALALSPRDEFPRGDQGSRAVDGESDGGESDGGESVGVSRSGASRAVSSVVAELHSATSPGPAPGTRPSGAGEQ